MGIKGLKHDAVAYNTMIDGCCRIGKVGRTEEFFREMGLSGVESSCVTFDHLINGYCKIGDVVEHGLRHLPFTEKQAVTPTGQYILGLISARNCVEFPLFEGEH
ncbi:hypothetical protein CsSME_00049441 [Camellia sinensis var. sinensis]